MAVLWTKTKKVSVPWEYTELMLMRDVYHCTRTQLYEQDIGGILDDLELLRIEGEVREFSNRK